MAEYIEREAIIEDFKNDLMCMKASVFQGTPMSEINIDNVIERIRDFPAADVAPVKRGEWILAGANKRGLAGNWKCTACNKLYPYKCDYCPNCGAKMKGEQHGT